MAIGNHWPSRLGGEYETAPYRIMAAETMAYWHQHIQEIKGTYAAVMAMGDFNDEPHSRSLMDYALSTRSRQKVTRSTSAPRMFNLMWPLMGDDLASRYFGNFPNMLDQFLVSRASSARTSPCPQARPRYPVC